MPLLHDRSGAASTVVEGASEHILGAIHTPGCAAAIWQRSLNPVFRTWLDTLPPAKLPQLREIVPAAQAGRAVSTAFEAAGVGPGAGRTMLCDDVQARVGCVARILGVQQIALRLDVVRGDACTRFHVDFVPARLLCTYRGQGTEYGISGSDGDPADIQRMQPGWVGLFRGQQWPSPEPCGLVHRSPPIGGTGETRLLLVVDVAEPEA